MSQPRLRGASQLAWGLRAKKLGGWSSLLHARGWASWKPHSELLPLCPAPPPHPGPEETLWLLPRGQQAQHGSAATMSVGHEALPLPVGPALRCPLGTSVWVRCHPAGLCRQERALGASLQHTAGARAQSPSLCHRGRTPKASSTAEAGSHTQCSKCTMAASQVLLFLRATPSPWSQIPVGPSVAQLKTNLQKTCNERLQQQGCTMTFSSDCGSLCLTKRKPGTQSLVH